MIGKVQAVLRHHCIIMSELKDKPIEHYQMNGPSEPILLHEGPMTLDLEWVASDVERKESDEPFKTTKTHKENITSEEGILKLEWHPTPTIRFELLYPPMLIMVIPLYKHGTLSVTDLDLKEEVYARIIMLEPGDPQYDCHKPSSAMQEGNLARKCVEMGTSYDRLNEVRFHIVNFRTFVCKWRDGEAEGIDWIENGWNIEVNGWDIDLRPAQNCLELINSMNRVGGFAITHVGLLKRIDGKEFSSEQAEKVLDALYYLFAFIRGRWCGIILPRGSAKDMPVWEKWDLTKPISPWGGINNWAASSSVVIDNNLIQQFISKWTIPEWQRDIKPVLNWYVEACLQGGGLEGAIAMTQFGLERLAWIELQNLSFSDLLTRERYDNIPASNKLRWLLTRKKIPVDMKESNLLVYTENNKQRLRHKLDGPELFTFIRNNIVHPEKDETTIPPVEVMRDAYSLGLWYLEMLLLHHLGHTGKCFNRRYGSMMDQVPWSNDEKRE